MLGSKKLKDGAKKRKLGRNPRVPFTQHQVSLLEQKFRRTHYLSSIDVAELSSALNLTENRVSKCTVRDVGNAWFPSFRCRFSVAVSPFPLRISMRWLVGVDDWLASYIRNGTTKKIELDPISTEERLRQLFVKERNFLT